MKTGAVKNTWATLGLVFTAASLMAMPQLGCGKPGADSSPLGLAGDGGQVPMRGYAGFGSQCPSGYNSDPKAVKLELWSCPVNLQTVELSEPMAPLMFQADCKRKTLAMRTLDRSVDTTWELHPDGSFYVTLEGMKAMLKSDGAGNSDCNVPLTSDIWGKVECDPNSNQATIKFETVMWLNKKLEPSARATPTVTPTVNPNLPPNGGSGGGSSTSPVTSPSPTPRPTSRLVSLLSASSSSARECQVPRDKCYFHAATTVDQCK